MKIKQLLNKSYQINDITWTFKFLKIIRENPKNFYFKLILLKIYHSYASDLFPAFFLGKEATRKEQTPSFKDTVGFVI